MYKWWNYYFFNLSTFPGFPPKLFVSVYYFQNQKRTITSGEVCNDTSTGFEVLSLKF